MLMFLMEAIQTNFQQASAVGSSSRAQQALNELHTQDKNVEMTDQLMVWWFLEFDGVMKIALIWEILYHLLFCVNYQSLFLSGAHTRLSGRGFWECEDELQWRPGTDNTATHQCTRPAACCHVCLILTPWPAPASCSQPWKGKGKLHGLVNEIPLLINASGLPIFSISAHFYVQMC